MPPHAFTFYKLYTQYKTILFLSCGPRLGLYSQSCVVVHLLGEVEGCPTHHPASVPSRMDVSMWRGVSMRLLTVKVSQRCTALPSTGQFVAHSSPVQSSLVGLIQKGCVDVKGWVGEKERLSLRNRGYLRASSPVTAALCWHTLDSYQHTHRDKKVTVHSTPTRLRWRHNNFRNVTWLLNGSVSNGGSPARSIWGKQLPSVCLNLRMSLTLVHWAALS